MGVDYYECDKCSFGFRDDDERVIWCESCCAKFCSKECAKPVMELNTAKMEEVPEDYEEYEVCVECCVCRKEHCSDDALLSFLLKHLELDREQAEKLYFEKQK